MKNLTFLLLFSVLFTFCKRSHTTAEENERIADSLAMVRIQDSIQMREKQNAAAVDPDKNANVEFSITNGNQVLRLRDARQSVNLRALGTPNDSLRREMTLVTDAYKGSSVQELKYDDINLEFFSPNANDKGWLRVIDVKGGPWATARGIRVGDSVTEFKNMYPSAKNESDDMTLFTYRLAESTLQFGTTADKVTRIRVEYHLP